MLNTGAITPKSEDTYVEKVFISTELHISEVTSFKIGTLNVNGTVRLQWKLGHNEKLQRIYLQCGADDEDSIPSCNYITFTKFVGCLDPVWLGTISEMLPGLFGKKQCWAPIWCRKYNASQVQ